MRSYVHARERAHVYAYIQACVWCVFRCACVQCARLYEQYTTILYFINSVMLLLNYVLSV